MARQALTGTRIRERRVLVGMKQADLARIVGISPSYLNLIEHNRRRIGTDLLVAIAGALGVALEVLTEGAEAALMDDLRSAASIAEVERPELDRLDELIGRFPGWARVLAATQRRLMNAERTIEALNDRLTHDPFLSASLHEVLSAATSVRSTAAILAETEDIEPEWRQRFHKNLNADSVRLAEGAEALAAWLDAAADQHRGLAAPQEEFDAWLTARGFHIAEAEQSGADIAAIVGGAPELASGAARDIATGYLRRYLSDAAMVTLPDLKAAIAASGDDPAELAQRFGVSVGVIFRRLAALPGEGFGLVLCDASGTLTFRKPADGFAIPRFGGACPLWPLYRALGRPLAPISTRIELAARGTPRFRVYALCEPVAPVSFTHPDVLEAAMLIMPDATATGAAAHVVGTTCRICPRGTCVARREPSIVSEGF